MAGTGAQADFARPARVVSMKSLHQSIGHVAGIAGQLISVSDLARDPRSSAMAAAAEAYPVNHARAERNLTCWNPIWFWRAAFPTRPH